MTSLIIREDTTIKITIHAFLKLFTLFFSISKEFGNRKKSTDN